MARIRTIKPEFWTSEQVVACSRDARLLFIGMWNFSDDAGIHPKSYKRLKMQVFPGDDCSEQDIKCWINELVTNKLLTEYSSDQRDYWLITGWKSHQKIDKPTYRHPNPYSANAKFSESSSNNQLTIDDDSTSTPLPLEEYSLNAHLRKGRERNGEEYICKIRNETLPPDDYKSSSDVQESKQKLNKQSLLVLEPEIPNTGKNVNTTTDYEIESLFNYWQSVMKHPGAILDGKRRKSIASALALGYSVSDLKKAIDGCARSPFNMGMNDNKKKYNDIGLIFRDADHIERYIRYEVDIESVVADPVTKFMDALSAGAI